MSRAVRSLPDHADADVTAIREALEKKSPLTPGELAAKTKLTAFTLRRRLEVAVSRGLVTKTGTGPRNTFVHLGKVKAAAAAPKPNGSMKPASSPSTLDQVESRDREVLMRIRNSGTGGRSMRELMISMSDESEDAIEKSLERLRIKKAIREDGGRWIAA